MCAQQDEPNSTPILNCVCPALIGRQYPVCFGEVMLRGEGFGKKKGRTLCGDSRAGCSVVSPSPSKGMRTVLQWENIHVINLCMGTRARCIRCRW